MSALRAAVLGCGPRGREHAAALASLDGIELAAVADLDAEQSASVAAELGVEARPGLAELLRDDAPELLVIATPPRGRAELVGQAAAAGGVRAIAVEKPLALRLDDAQAMIAACEREDVRLAVGLQLRFTPELVALHEAIERGELGDIELIRGVCFGNLLDQGPHLLDAICWLSGGRKVLWAMSQRGDAAAAGRPAAALPPAGDAHPAPPWMTSYLCLDGDLRAVLESGAMYQRSRQFLDDWLQMRIVVVGSEGVGEAQVASHAVLRNGNGNGRLAEGSLESYVEATRSFHAALRDAIVTGGAHSTLAADTLPSFEALLACAQSAVDGDAAVLPLDPGRDPLAELAAAQPEARRATRGTRATDGLEVSIIVPLPDHRGYAEDCVRSWVETQTLAGERFELIVPTDGTEPELEARIEALLRPGDRLLRLGPRHEIELYDEAARAARSDLLLLSEPHCIAEPGCLEELVRFVAAGNWDGACLRSTAINGNGLSRGEEQMYDEGFAEWSREGHWCKVILRGFAIKREAFIDAGGFEPRFGRFAEFLLALRLHRTGRRLGYATGASVRHAYTTSIPEFEAPTRDFTRGECAYRLEAPQEEYEPLLGTPPTWEDEVGLARGYARGAWWIALRNLPRRSVRQTPAAARGTRSTLRRTAPAALLGMRAALLGARVRLALARLRCLAWRPYQPRLTEAFADTWASVVETARLEWLAAERPPPGPLAPLGRLELPDLPPGRAFGLLPVEEEGGWRFRWTRSVALLELPIAASAGELRLEIAPLRPADAPLCLWAFVNGQRLPPAAVRVEPELITIDLTGARLKDDREQRLALTVAPVEQWRNGSPDRRELGLPLAALEAR